MQNGTSGKSRPRFGGERQSPLHRAVQVQKNCIRAALLVPIVLAPAIVLGDTNAGASLSRSLQVSAYVLPNAAMKTLYQKKEITITSQDVAAGQITEESATIFSVATTRDTRYLVMFSPRGPLFSALRITGLRNAVTFNSEGGSVAQVGAGLQGSTTTLSYVFEINPDTVPGVYEWPVQINVHAY